MDLNTNFGNNLFIFEDVIWPTVRDNWRKWRIWGNSESYFEKQGISIFYNFKMLYCLKIWSSCSLQITFIQFIYCLETIAQDKISSQSEEIQSLESELNTVVTANKELQLEGERLKEELSQRPARSDDDEQKGKQRILELEEAYEDSQRICDEEKGVVKYLVDVTVIKLWLNLLKKKKIPLSRNENS